MRTPEQIKIRRAFARAFAQALGYGIEESFPGRAEPFPPLPESRLREILATETEHSTERGRAVHEGQMAAIRWMLGEEPDEDTIDCHHCGVSHPYIGSHCQACHRSFECQGLGCQGSDGCSCPQDGSAPTEAVVSWNYEMRDAPRDGTPLRLLIPESGGDSDPRVERMGLFGKDGWWDPGQDEALLRPVAFASIPLEPSERLEEPMPRSSCRCRQDDPWGPRRYRPRDPLKRR